jgi:hypothetical protein
MNTKFEVTNAMLRPAAAAYLRGSPYSFAHPVSDSGLRAAISAAIEASGLVERIAELETDLDIWMSVFPDIAPENVLPDRSTLEAENARLREALQRMLLEFDFMIEANMIPDTRNDVIFVEARSALKECEA